MAFPLIVITTEEVFPEEVRLLKSMLAVGAWRVHLRHPRLSSLQMADLLRCFSQVEQVRISLSRHADLLNDFPEVGYHLREGETLDSGFSLPPCLSQSCHDPKSLPKGNLNYVFLGPVFSSISKKGYAPRGDFPPLPKRRDGDPLRIALGGITGTRLSAVAEKGFDGAAAIGSIWGHKNPLYSFEQLKEQLHGT